MTRTLHVSGGKPRILTSTTTTKMAQRMLHASRAVADVLPDGFQGSCGLDIILALHLAEDSAQYPSAGEIDPPGSLSPTVTGRWIKALVQQGLVEQDGELLALSAQGHDMVIELLERVFDAQRRLD